MAALKEELAARLGFFYKEAIGPYLKGDPRLVGTAGAVTTLAAMQLKLRAYDPNQVNNLILTRAQVAALAELMAGLPEAARARLTGIEPAKAGVMVAGALIILTILDGVPAGFPGGDRRRAPGRGLARDWPASFEFRDSPEKDKINYFQSTIRFQPGDVIMIIRETNHLTLFRLAWLQNLATGNSNAGG